MAIPTVVVLCIPPSASCDPPSSAGGWEVCEGPKELLVVEAIGVYCVRVNVTDMEQFVWVGEPWGLTAKR